ncbi:MFS transporter [Methylopila sp. 73B]|uniref:MFS transporter n=1 Tax=Methylopila sp. 73B TaxID=1120792 RepID=UPI00035F377F|nr:MFS transporter [Methylopila sp. 73B]
MTAAVASTADRRRLAYARAAVAAAFFVAGAAMGVWAAHIPLLKAGLDVDDAALGFVLLAMGIGAVCAMPPTGLLLHRFGAVAMTIASAFSLASALALAPLAPSYPALIAAAAFIGLSMGAIDVSMNAQAAAIETAWGRPIMSSIHAFFSIGGLAGATASGGLIALDVGAVAGMGLSALALGAVVALAATRLAIAAHGAPDEPHGLRLPRGVVLGLGLLTLAAFLSEGAMIDWSAVFMIQATGATPALAAVGYAAFSAAMTFGRLTGDAFVARLGPLRAVQVSGAVAAAGLAIVVAAPTPTVAIAGFVVAGLGFANVVPVLFSASTRLPGVAPGAALSMVATMAYGGGLMGPPLIGFLAHGVGLRWALLPLVFAALAIAAFVRRAAKLSG